MTFVKDNKIWLIKDVSVVPKSKREFFGKDYDRMYHRNRSDIAGSVLLKTCFDGIMVLMEIIIRQNCFQRKTKYLFL